MVKIIKKLFPVFIFLSVISQTYPVPQINSDDRNFYKLTELSEEEWNSRVPEDISQAYKAEVQVDTPFDTVEYFTVLVKNKDMSSRLCAEFKSQVELLGVYYESRQTGAWSSHLSGDQIPMSRRDLPSSFLVIPLNLKKGEDLELYIQVRDYHHKEISMRINTPRNFLLQTNRLNAFYYFSHSLILIVALYHFFMFLTGKKRFFLYYALVMICLVITRMGKTRDLSFLFLQDSPYGYFVYLFFSSLAIIFSLLFFRSFFSIPRKSWTGRILAVFTILMSGIAIASVVNPAPLIGAFMNMLIVPSLLFCFYLVLQKSLKGNTSTRILLFSFIPLIGGVILDNLFIYLAVFHLNRPVSMTLIGTVLHTLMMSYSLAHQQAESDKRYSDLRQTFDHKVDRSVKERTLELENHVQRDTLTGLYNRAGLEEKVRKMEKESGGCLGILFTDLDNFKYYNDTFGHDTGDDILRSVARFLKKQLRQQDMVFRYGGDEFLVLMPDTELDQGETLTRRLHKEFQAQAKQISRDLKDDTGGLGISMGLAGWRPGCPLGEVISQADQTLLSAKAEGKNRLLVHQGCII